MRKIIFMMFFLLIPAVWMLPETYAQEDMERIDNSVFQHPVRSEALFPHDSHNEKAEIEECSTCHHVYEQGKLVEGESSEDQRCSECHSLQKQGNTPSLMRAFHLNCKQCHMAGKVGPILCGECHPKTERE
jgi:hypothetical protein